jgi:hypothetical protein
MTARCLLRLAGAALPVKSNRAPPYGRTFSDRAPEHPGQMRLISGSDVDGDLRERPAGCQQHFLGPIVRAGTQLTRSYD